MVYKALNVETGRFIAVKHIKMAIVDLESSMHLDNLSKSKGIFGQLNKLCL